MSHNKNNIVSSTRLLLQKSNGFGLWFVLVIHSLLIAVSKGQLEIGSYSRTCPNAESIIHDVVEQAVSKDPQNAPRLLRLAFHDCFVEGCDGSVLLDNGEKDEKKATGNLGLAGFEVIENAKQQLEGTCPGIVSCADIVAIAARDAVSLTKGPFYEVPTGRRDGRVSDISHAAILPEADDPIELLRSRFKEKGLTDEDLVLLSAGGHSIGTTACFFMPKRLYNFTGKGDSDPKINPLFLRKLQSTCPPNGDVNVRLAMDWNSEFEFDDQILHNIRNGFAVLASDARLYDDVNTRRVIDSYFSLNLRDRPNFGEDFGRAMVKLGNVGVKTGSQGEIRRVCNRVN